MPSLTSIKEVLDKLLKEVSVGPTLPEKVITFGGPEDTYRKIVETFTMDDEGTMHVDRCVQYRQPIDYIRVDLKIEDVRVGDEKNEYGRDKVLALGETECDTD